MFKFENDKLELEKEFIGHHMAITDLEVSPRQERVWSCSKDKTIRVYDSNAKFLRKLSFGKDANSPNMMFRGLHFDGTFMTVLACNARGPTYLIKYDARKDLYTPVKW